MGAKFLTRRQFLTLTAAAGAGAALAACGAAPTPVPPAAPAVPSAAAPTAAAAPAAAPVAAEAREAPMLAELVQAGKLPPLNERLPVNPKVITPIEKVGRYGGTLNRGTLSVGSYVTESQAHEPLFELAYPVPGKGSVEPNLAESWQFSNDGKELTCKLRKGLKWSDGEPFTADDILFMWEDVWFTKEALQPAPSAVYPEAGKPPTLAKVDDNTIKFTFHVPFYFAETQFATMATWAWPKHYLAKQHPKYNPNATWEEFVKTKLWHEGHGKATMQAWMLDEFQADKGLKMVRNPYYWKVDTEGNQLPYIDRYNWNIVADRPTIALKCVAGEIDVDGMWVGIPQIPLFFEEKDKRGFDLGWYFSVSAWGMYPNYDHPDETIRATLRNLNFRRAVALAIDRQALNKTFYYNLVDIFNACFNDGTGFQDPECNTIYSSYDPVKANMLLDEAGFKDVNNDGKREAQNGKPLQLVIDVYQHDLYVPLMEMVTEQLKAIGLDVVLNIQLQDAIFARRAASEHMLAVFDSDFSAEPMTRMNELIPVTPNTPWWHPKASEAPFSPEYARIIELVSAAPSLPRDQMVKNMQEAGRIMAENVLFWSIGSMRRPYFIGKDIRNVPKEATRVPADTPPLRLYQAYLVRS